jgi:hypothetical protein
MKVPSQSLLELSSQCFSRQWLDDVATAAQRLPPLTHNLRLAVYVLRKVCDEASQYLESVGAVTVARHQQVEDTLLPPMQAIVGKLVTGENITDDLLAALIRASEEVRIAQS